MRYVLGKALVAISLKKVTELGKTREGEKLECCVVVIEKW